MPEVSCFLRLSFSLRALVLVVVCCPGLVHAQFAGGDGSIDAPWQIATSAQLRAVDAYMDRTHVYFELVADVDLGGTDPNGPFWSDGKGWLPFASNTSAEFMGVLDGNGHTIRGLYINRPDQEHVAGGLFEALAGTVRDLRLEVNITSAVGAGGLASSNVGTISNVDVTGSITGKDNVGGLVAGNIGTITNSRASVRVHGRNYVGGLAGFNAFIIESSSASGNVTGESNIGGIVGMNIGQNGQNGIVRRSFATGNVTASSWLTGGLVGNNSGTVYDSYASGDVTGLGTVGSFAGYSSGTLERCYATGRVSGSATVTARGCYWDIGTTGIPQGGAGEGRTTAELQTAAAYTGWDFDAVWQLLPEAYPTLRATQAPGDVVFDGSGTIDDPWQVATPRQFNDIRNRTDQHFILVADIDLGGDDPNGPFWNEGLGWDPIGDGWVAREWFSGSLDGDGHNITGLYMNRPAQADTVGLFGWVNGGRLANLRLIDVDVRASDRDFGALAGRNAGDISNSQVTGRVIGTNTATGGLVGENSGLVTNSSFIGEVHTGDRWENVAGGLVAINSGTITHSRTAGLVVNLNGNAGGLVGNNSGTVATSSSSTIVESPAGNAGGLVGSLGGTLSNSFATGRVSGTGAAGGLVGTGAMIGFVGNAAAITNSFATGSVNGGSATGGLVGQALDPARVKDSYWNIETSGLATSAAGIGKTTAQLQDRATFANWDFTFIWNASTAAYPSLRSAVQFAGGDGSVARPWQIATQRQLALVRQHMNKHFVLTADIDLGGSDPAGLFWNEGKGWLPLGWEFGESGQLMMRQFTGSLDGAGHAIRNLYINNPVTFGYVGFISHLKDGTVRNLEFTNVDIATNTDAAAVVGFNEGTLHNVHVTGSIAGPGIASDLAAYHFHGASDGYAHLSGTEQRTLRLENAFLGRVRLSHVIIGAGNHYSGGLELGPGVYFEANALIPAGNLPEPQNLSAGLPQIPWAPYPQLSALGLEADVLVVAPGSTEATILDAMQRLPLFSAPGSSIAQNAAGELLATQPSFVAKLLPVRVVQDISGNAPGTYISESGDIEFIIASGRRVTAWPLVMDLPFFRQEVQRVGLTLGGDPSGNFKLSSLQSGDYYLTRPSIAVAAATDAQPGLVGRAAQGLTNVIDYSLIYRDAQNRLMQHALAPRPVDWVALRNRILSFGVDEVRIDLNGIITAQLGGNTINARLSYEVTPSGTPGPTYLTMLPVGDLNGDGTNDYELFYPNGDLQWLYIYP